MPRIKSDDARISYEILGDGPPLVLLHPFPANHEYWLPLAQKLSTRYRLILPDLRGHGDSEIGEGAATMAKHAADIARVMDDAREDRAGFAGVSIGGYVLLEFWRRSRDRVSAMVLSNTQAQADSAEARNARLRSAATVVEAGTEQFFQDVIPKLIGETTRATRPDLVEGALRMMRKMSAEDIALVQRGMAERPDSVATLKTVSVPAMIIAGEEDHLMAQAEVMRQNISASRFKVIPKAGHFRVGTARGGWRPAAGIF